MEISKKKKKKERKPNPFKKKQKTILESDSIDEEAMNKFHSIRNCFLTDEKNICLVQMAKKHMTRCFQHH